jgi:hypothetical protein
MFLTPFGEQGITLLFVSPTVAGSRFVISMVDLICRYRHYRGKQPAAIASPVSAASSLVGAFESTNFSRQLDPRVMTSCCGKTTVARKQRSVERFGKGDVDGVT